MHWAGLNFSVPSAAAAKSRQSCLTLCDPIDGSPPGSPVPGILQARVLEWGAVHPLPLVESFHVQFIFYVRMYAKTVCEIATWSSQIWPYFGQLKW